MKHLLILSVLLSLISCKKESTGEVCNNGIDDDENGLVDCSDPACEGDSSCEGQEVCDNGVDDNGDGAVDCDDEACFDFAACKQECTPTSCSDLEQKCTDPISICPDGENCYGGVCQAAAPTCWTTPMGGISGQSDTDFEPNNHPDFATPLSSVTIATELAICGEGDKDIYSFTAQQGDIHEIVVLYFLDNGGALRASVFNKVGDVYNVNSPLVESQTPEDGEVIEFEVQETGTYYLVIEGATPDQFNGYALHIDIY